MSEGDLILVDRVKYSNSKAEVSQSIIVTSEPELVKAAKDSYWQAWGYLDGGSLFLLQWVYPYATGVMVFTSDPVTNKGTSSWMYTILNCSIHKLEP